jgi:hypothetical protein
VKESLSFWIRDYLFVPLAAARRNRWWQYVVFVISMTLFGLWHAARLTLIFWGFYHGLLLVMHRLGQQVKRQFSVTLPRYLGLFLAWVTTFSLVSLGWIFFRANDLNVAFSMFRSILSPKAYLHSAMPRNFYILTSAIVIGYFVYEAGNSLLLSWRVRYRTAIGESTTNLPLKIGALVDFFAERLWWWFAPAVLILTLFVGVAIYEQSVVITVTPFIYTLF